VLGIPAVELLEERQLLGGIRCLQFGEALGRGTQPVRDARRAGLHRPPIRGRPRKLQPTAHEEHERPAPCVDHAESHRKTPFRPSLLLMATAGPRGSRWGGSALVCGRVRGRSPVSWGRRGPHAGRGGDQGKLWRRFGTDVGFPGGSEPARGACAASVRSYALGLHTGLGGTAAETGRRGRGVTLFKVSRLVLWPMAMALPQGRALGDCRPSGGSTFHWAVEVPPKKKPPACRGQN
jgi:hypothetical protein